MKVDNLPQHVAIIMDGNRRWAKAKGLPVAAGHKVVVDKRIEELIERAGELGIAYITFWAWSSENWSRPELEVGAVMQLFRYALKRKAKKMIERGARLRVIGNWRAFDEDIVMGIEEMLNESAKNTKVNVTFGLNYGGRDEILRSFSKILKSTDNNQPTTINLNQEIFSSFLDTAGMPDPDLIIRTGGEQRLSGFMLWQAQYSELFFPDTLMPDFGKAELDKALEEYVCRQRRFGG